MLSARQHQNEIKKNGWWKQLQKALCSVFLVAAVRSCARLRQPIDFLLGHERCRRFHAVDMCGGWCRSSGNESLQAIASRSRFERFKRCVCRSTYFLTIQKKERWLRCQPHSSNVAALSCYSTFQKILSPLDINQRTTQLPDLRKAQNDTMKF